MWGEVPRGSTAEIARRALMAEKERQPDEMVRLTPTTVEMVRLILDHLIRILTVVCR